MTKNHTPFIAFFQEKKSHAHENGIQWREDSSNASDKYLRNKIRHDLVPLLKEVKPYFIPVSKKHNLICRNHKPWLKTHPLWCTSR
jgi:tRNA(Ile)-lysidine synthase TilS/MesJ